MYFINWVFFCSFLFRGCLIMKIVNILCHHNHLSFFIQKFVTDYVYTYVSDIRFTFRLCTIKVLQPFPDTKGIFLKIHKSEKLFRRDTLQFFLGPVPIFISKSRDPTCSRNSSTCHKNNLFFIFQQLSYLLWSSILWNKIRIWNLKQSLSLNSA